jgi:hypothetical protein
MKKSVIHSGKSIRDMMVLFGAAFVLLGLVASPTHAQFTTNPVAYATTNTTRLVSIGNGFGVALLGYGMPEYNPLLFIGANSNNTFFATPGGQPGASDATLIPAGTTQQFYVVYSDKDGRSLTNQSDVVAFKVSVPVSNPTNLTIIRTWVARTETNNIGTVQGASLGAGGITTNGIIGMRADGTLSPNGNAASQAIFTLDANTLSTVVISNYLSAAYGGLVTNISSANTLTLPGIGRDVALLTGSSFGNYNFVARSDITGSGSLSPNGQLIGAFPNRGLASMNDRAKSIAGFWKDPLSDGSSGDGSDQETHLIEWRYTDTGGSITINSVVTNTFGTRNGNDLVTSTINTNLQEFFGATPFNGPAQLCINDNGDMALPVSINCTYGNGNQNGTRSSIITGIIFKPGGTTNVFRKVTDNTDPKLFYQANGTAPTTTNVLISPPVLDNSGNVFFESSFSTFQDLFVITSITRSNNDVVIVWNAKPDTNIVQATTIVDASGHYAPIIGIVTNYTDLATNVVARRDSLSYTDVGGATNKPARYYRVKGLGVFDITGNRNSLNNALYEAVANTYPNPTSWTVKRLLSDGDIFTEPVSGNQIQILSIGFFSGQGNSSQDNPRSLGGQSINRTPVPSSGNPLGGVVVCATLTNLNVDGVNSRFDGVLYVAPVP